MTEQTRMILKTGENLANAIRRYAGEILVPAIDSVEIHKNDSALYDEVLAQRIGLVPIKTSRKLKDSESCTCKGEGCTKCQLQLTLKAKGPCVVYSGDIKGDVDIIYDKMPLVILDKEQELEILCFVQLGKGRNHAKFSPGLVYYRNVSEVKAATDEINKIAEILKENVIEKKGGVLRLDCDLDYINAVLKDKAKFEASLNEDEIVFFVEPWGQIPAEEIFSESVKELNKELKEFLKVLK